MDPTLATGLYKARPRVLNVVASRLIITARKKRRSEMLVGRVYTKVQNWRPGLPLFHAFLIRAPV